MTQLIYVVGAIALLGMLMVPSRRLALDRQSVLMSSEAMSTGTALGQELIEQVVVRKFDQNYSGTGEKTTDATKFSSTPGRDGVSEIKDSMQTFNDVDDFNGYQKIVATPRLGNFTETCTVYYVNENSPDQTSNTQTFVKRIDVKIRHAYIPTADSTLTISKIVSYRYKG